MLKQSLQQKLLQKLSPQQIQFIKLLQVPTAALEARIKQELEENPALMEGDNLQDEYADLEASDDELKEENLDEPNEISIDEYLEKEDYAYKTRLASDPDEDRYETPIVGAKSLFDLLMQQVQLVRLDEKQKVIARQIIGNIDEDGYFRRPIESIVDDLAFRQNVTASEQEVEEVLAKVQQLDPAGVGARDLQECLLLQLDRKPASDEVELAQSILMDHFESFSKKHFQKIIDRTGGDRELFKAAYELITKLNPKPGTGESALKGQYIIPDFILSIRGEEIDIQLNKRNAPQLNVNKGYMGMLKRLEEQAKNGDSRARESLTFVKSKIDSAKWFIDAIVQRQFTLLKTMGSIVGKQRAFFLSEGDTSQLRPMILKDVAEEIEMDISTVSRVANSKYVETEFGIFPLKFFFSEGIQTESGEEVSNREVKAKLKKMIDAESKRKPLSDDKLAKLLKDEGYNIARRTVAKYREQMNIPVARLRKEVV